MRRGRLAAAAVISAALIMAAALSGCGGAERSAGETTLMGGEDAVQSSGGAEAGKGAYGGSQDLRAETEGVAADIAADWNDASPAPSQPKASFLDQLQLKVIKTALVKMEVGKGEYGSLREDAVAAAKAVGGYVEGESSSRDGDGYTHATLTLRVPADRFDETLEEVSSLGEITSSQVSTNDVSEEYVDLESRLRHLQTQEQFYLELISKAKSVHEMITIREHLDSIQQEKERVKGRMNFLDKQVGFSTLTLSVDETSGEAEDEGFWRKVGEAFKSFGRAMKKLAVGFFYALPYLATLAIAAAACLFLVRRARRPRSERQQETD